MTPFRCLKNIETISTYIIGLSETLDKTMQVRHFKQHLNIGFQDVGRRLGMLAAVGFRMKRGRGAPVASCEQREPEGQGWGDGWPPGRCSAGTTGRGRGWSFQEAMWGHSGEGRIIK